MSINLTTLHTLLAAALTEHQAASPRIAEDNPANGFTETELWHGKGIFTSADQYPALDMAAKLNGTQIAVDIEQNRRAGLEAGKADTSAKRHVESRARAARKAQIDALAASPVVPASDRLAAAWLVVLPMSEIVTKIAQSKKAWASRFLGSNVDDVAQIALEQMVLVLAKGDDDLAVLKISADELGGIIARTGQVPTDQVIDKDAKRERKAVAKGRKWLMGMANNRVMGALSDTYTAQLNERCESIDLVATVMHNINGAGEDPTTTHFKASKAPSMMGTRFQRPGSFDGNWLATAISAAITDRGLDQLTEIMLDDERRQTNGAFQWSENAEAVFLSTPGGNGAWQWSLVCTATAQLNRAANRRGEAAAAHARNLFAWLPSFIMAVIDAFDQYEDTLVENYIGGEPLARMTSVFEQFLTKPAERAPRLGLRPALNYATAEDAAAALTEHLAMLVDGVDFASSVAHA